MDHTVYIIIPTLAALIAAYFSTPFFRILAVKLRILDLPNRRKIHKRATPLLGGLGVFSGLVAGVIINWQNLNFLLPVFYGAIIIVILGFIDDTRGLSARVRLFIELSLVLVISLMGIRVTFMPDTWWGNISEIIITMFWVVGVTNAYNYLDGLDGLAAGSAVVNLFCFAAILYGSAQYALAAFVLSLMSGCLGFLPYNFRKAKIFLGDTGSTLIGFLLAYIGIIGYWASDNVVKISIPILILGVPIFDMIFTTIMRIKEAKVKTFIEWLKYGGKDHFHHYLVDLGLSPIGAVLFIYFITFSLGISAIMVSNDRASEAFMSLAQAGIIFGIIAVLIVIGKKRRTGWNSN